MSISDADEYDQLNLTLGTDISDAESLSQLQPLFEGLQGNPNKPISIAGVSYGSRTLSTGHLPSGFGISNHTANYAPHTFAEYSPETQIRTKAAHTISSTPTSAVLHSPSSARFMKSNTAGRMSTFQETHTEALLNTSSVLGTSQDNPLSKPFNQNQGYTDELERRIAKLQNQLRTQERESRSTKNRDHSRIADLEAQLADLQRALRGEQQKGDREISKLQSEIAQLKKNHTVEVDKLREELRTVTDISRNASPDGFSAQSFAVLKAQLSNLRVPEAVYLEYKAKPQDSLTLREYVCIQVYELTLSQSKIQEQLHAELQEAKSLEEGLREEALQAKKLCDQERRTRERQVLQLQQVSKELESQLATCEGHLATCRVQLREQRDKSLQFDVIRAKADSLERRMIEAEAALKSERNQQQSNIDELGKLRSQTQLDSQELSKLRSDKQFLRQELEAARTENKRVSEECASLRKRNDQLERAKRDLTDELLRAETDARIAYDNKLDKELSRIGALSDAEVAKLRSHQQDMFNRELAQLRENLDLARREADNLRSQLEATRRCADADSETNRATRAQLESQLADVRGELKIKVFESERAISELALNSRELEKLKVILDTERAKAEIVKEEFFTLREEVGIREASWRQEEKLLRDQIANYETLEHDLDLAIMKAGKDVASAFSSGEVCSEPNLSQTIRGVNAVLSSIGTNGTSSVDSAKRRVKQSLMLAHRLTQKQRELDEIRKDLSQAQALCTKLQLDNSNLQRAVIRGASIGTKEKVDDVSSDSSVLQQDKRVVVGGSSSNLNTLTCTLRAQNDEIRELRAEISSKEAIQQTLRARITVLETQIETEREKARSVCSKLAKDLRRLHQNQKQVGVAREVVKRLVRLQTSQSVDSHAQRQMIQSSGQQTELIKQLQSLLRGGLGSPQPQPQPQPQLQQRQLQQPQPQQPQPQQPQRQLHPQLQLQHSYEDQTSNRKNLLNSTTKVSEASSGPSSHTMRDLANLLRNCLTSNRSETSDAQQQVPTNVQRSVEATTEQLKPISTQTEAATVESASERSKNESSSEEQPHHSMSASDVSTASKKDLPRLPNPDVQSDSKTISKSRDIELANTDGPETSSRDEFIQSLPSTQEQGTSTEGATVAGNHVSKRNPDAEIVSDRHAENVPRVPLTQVDDVLNKEQEDLNRSSVSLLIHTPRDIVYTSESGQPVLRIYHSIDKSQSKISQNQVQADNLDKIIVDSEFTANSQLGRATSPLAAVRHIPIEHLASVAEPFPASGSIRMPDATLDAQYDRLGIPIAATAGSFVSQTAFGNYSHNFVSARSEADSYASEKFSDDSFSR